MNASDLSAAQRAVAEFEQLTRDLMLAQDEAKQLREVLGEKNSYISMLEAQTTRLHQELADERLRTNRWIVMSTRMTANIEMVNTITQHLRATAIEAAQAVASRDLERELTPQELESLERLASGTKPPESASAAATPGATPLPSNNLRSSE